MRNDKVAIEVARFALQQAERLLTSSRARVVPMTPELRDAYILAASTLGNVAALLDRLYEKN